MDLTGMTADTASDALGYANQAAVVLSMDDRPDLPWCGYPLFVAVGWFSAHLMLGMAECALD